MLSSLMADPTLANLEDTFYFWCPRLSEIKQSVHSIRPTLLSEAQLIEADKW